MICAGVATARGCIAMPLVYSPRVQAVCAGLFRAAGHGRPAGFVLPSLYFRGDRPMVLVKRREK